MLLYIYMNGTNNVPNSPTSLKIIIKTIIMYHSQNQSISIENIFQKHQIILQK